MQDDQTASSQINGQKNIQILKNRNPQNNCSNPIKDFDIDHEAKIYFDEVQDKFFKIIDYEKEQHNIKTHFNAIVKFFSEKIKLLNQAYNINEMAQVISNENLKLFLKQIKDGKELLIEKNKFLKIQVYNLIKDLIQLACKQNYKHGDINNTLNDEIRIGYLQEEKLKNFIRGDNNDSVLYYNQEGNRYSGQVISQKQDNIKIMKRKNGFGYYKNSEKKICLYGLFKEDEFLKGISEIENNSFFNGEFSSHNDIFKGLFLNYKKNSDIDYSNYYLLGEANLEKNCYEGFYLKIYENQMNVYFGDLNNFEKNSKNALLIDFVLPRQKFILNSEPQQVNIEDFDFKLFYGDFVNNSPAVNEKSNEFYVVEDNRIFRIKNDKNVETIVNLEKENNEIKLISQGHIRDKLLNGEGNLLDLNRKIFYIGNFENGLYKGNGKLLHFDQIENPTKLIFILGNFSENEISQANVYLMDDNKFLHVENAMLTNEFELTYAKINFENNEYYEGEIKNFQRHGQGNYYYSSKSFYSGEWMDDKKNGHGFYTDEEGVIHKGKWIDDAYENDFQ